MIWDDERQTEKEKKSLVKKLNGEALHQKVTKKDGFEQLFHTVLPSDIEWTNLRK